MDPIRADPGATFASHCNNGQIQGGLHPGLGDSERELLVRRACGEVRQSVSTMFRDMSSNFSANDQRSIEVLASGIPQHHGAWVAVISQRGAHLFVCGKRPRQRGCRERSSSFFFPELGRTRRGSTRNSLTPKRCKLETGLRLQRRSSGLRLFPGLFPRAKLLLFSDVRCVWDGDEDGVACSCVRAFSARRVTCLRVGEAVPQGPGHGVHRVRSRFRS